MSLRSIAFPLLVVTTGLALAIGATGPVHAAGASSPAAAASPAAAVPPPSSTAAAAPGSAVSAAVPGIAAAPQAPLTPQSINAATLSSIPAVLAPPLAAPAAGGTAVPAAPPKPVASPAIVKLEILLDRVGASPGVIDGFDGENVRKAIAAYEIMQGQKPDGIASPALLATLDASQPVIGGYTIAPQDGDNLVSAIPTDYGEMAKLKWLGYTSIAEALAERFHMDEDFLKALNPGAQFAPGETVAVAMVGAPQQGAVALIQADKAARQVRAYDAQGRLLAAYPATIGSTDTPSPTGTHTVINIVHNPTYTYNPNLNFKQGHNDQVLTIAPGPNGPVGDVWIGLSTPTYGIHGTPEPSLIDKTASHGCVRLTNWDANELAGMVSKGVRVDFVN